MPTNYQIQIAMSDATITSLRAGGYFLYGFKGVQSTMAGGAPLVWFQTQTYSQATQVQWEEEYLAYTSLSAIIPNGKILASASYPIDLGQTLQVTGASGTGTPVSGGTEGAISILNQTQPPVQFACGISQMQNTGGTSAATPLCAFPLYGTGLDVMAPIERVLLMFATQSVNTGTVIYKAYSQGLLIDLTGVTSREVQFDINTGWSAGGGTWATPVPASADLAPLLIESGSNALSHRSIESLHANVKRLA